MRFINVFALSAAVLCVPAFAQSASITVEAAAPLSSGMYQTRTAAVNYGDLDVTTSAGAQQLLERIDATSRSLCSGPRATPSSLARPVESCRKQALAQAIATAKLPMLSQLASAR